MIRKLKCLIKGHNFRMKYNQLWNYYTSSAQDRCLCCHKKRGFK
jgi:hypothetical protein